MTQTRVRAEGDRGLAIQSIGEAVASRAYRVQRISCFRSPGEACARGGLPATRHGALPRILLRKRSATPRPEIYLVDQSVEGCGVVDLADGTRRRRRHAERAHKEREKEEKNEKKRREKAVRTIVFFETRRETLSSSERQHSAGIDDGKIRRKHIPALGVWWWMNEE